MLLGGEQQEERGVPATVVALLPQAKVRLELENRSQILAHAAGVPLVNFMRLRPGDRVLVELSPHDRSRGRIMRLLPR